MRVAISILLLGVALAHEPPMNPDITNSQQHLGARDGAVDIHDLLFMFSNWGNCRDDDQTWHCMFSDLNHDGWVGINDFFLLLSQWSLPFEAIFAAEGETQSSRNEWASFRGNLHGGRVTPTPLFNGDDSDA